MSVDGVALRLTSPDRVLWPAQDLHPAVEKRDLMRYLFDLSERMLPHLEGRPLTAVRYPQGVDGPRIFQKNWTRLPGPWLNLVNAPADKPNGRIDSITVENRASLVWLAQMGVLEFHPWLSRATATDGDRDPFNHPDLLVFDLDPFVPVNTGPLLSKPPLNRLGFAKALKVAKGIRSLLSPFDLTAYVKTSGKSGVHVYVPIERRYPFEVTRALAEAVGGRLVREMPDDVTLAHSIPERSGKVLVDYGQNGKGKNQVAPYSPRAIPGAPVSMPVPWERLESVYPMDFTIPKLLEGGNSGDAWKGFFSMPGRLEKALGAFGLGNMP